jgi:hypothetical protein
VEGDGVLRRELSLPRTWFLTARLLEAVAVLLVAGAAYELWLGWNVPQDYYTTDPNEDAPLMPRLVNMALFSAFRGPLNLMLAALAVAAVVAILLRAQPVSQARILRWEALGAGLAAGLLALLHVVVLVVVGLFGGESMGGPGFVGPDLMSQVFTSAPWPIASLLVVVTAAVWWLRLPAEFEDLPGEQPVRGPGDAEDEAVVDRAIADDSPFGGPVEQIEPVERLHLRERPGSDGSTVSGYDDYFRRS